MSHLKERAEKICLNCNAQLAGPFCHICGQENIEPKESAWHLIIHFFNDITHFDGKFFSTTGLLIKKPGLLPWEYMNGRRASYLNPIRMYVFTSAVFFLIFFAVVHVTDQSFDNAIRVEGKTFEQIRKLQPDSLAAFTARNNHGKSVPYASLEKYFDSIRNISAFQFTGRKYSSKREYDSLLNNGVKQHNWLERQLIYKEIELGKKYHNSGKGIFTSLITVFLHSFPQMLFISLPIFALLLKLLYWRKKEYYYVSHGIFSIHFLIFVFIVMLLMLGIGQLKEILHWQWLVYIQRLLGFGIFFYLYKAMRNFYQQGRAKTIVKFILLSFLSLFMLMFLFLFFLLFSLMKI